MNSKHCVLNIIVISQHFTQVTQLTGFSDPVYAEAYVNVNQYDIVLDVLIVNQTRDTLQACTLELATLGDLKLVEKPQVRIRRYIKERAKQIRQLLSKATPPIYTS